MEGPAPGRRGRRSSSRSPSLTRRPSLREKGGSGISKGKKKVGSGKKERWLLTRKTWRYMTDAVGNLLPEHHRSAAGPSTTSSPEPLAPPAAMGVVPCGHGSGTILAGAGAAYEGRNRQSIARASICSGSGTGYASTPPDDILGLETEFATVCTKERKFLLWTRTRAKGLSGPALRELKEKQKKGLSEFGPDVDDDYDEYEEEPEERVRVRERRRKSSAASSIVSMVSGGLAFFRPFSQSQAVTTHSVSGSGDSFYFVTTEGVSRHYRSTGIQTEPFPEEILIRLRLKSVQEEKLLQRQEEELRRSQQLQLEQPEPEIQPPPAGSPPLVTPQVSPPLQTEESLSPPPGEASGQTEPDKKSEESGYSSSISDTVMRYLRMARKNSKADTKEAIDRFKTVNYDRSLRNIKSKNVTLEEALEHEKNKALQAQQKLEAAEQAAAAQLNPPTPTPKSGPSAPPASPPPVPDPKATSPPPVKTGKAPKTTKATGVKTKTTGKKTKASTTPTTVSQPMPIPGAVQETGPKPVDPITIPGSPTEEPPLSPTSPTFSSSVSSTTSATLVMGQEEGDKSVQTTVPAETERPGPAPRKDSLKSRAAPPVHDPRASIGVQAGESLIRFLRYFNPRRKLSDFSSTSDSPAELTSPRYSIGTGSDTSDLYVLMHQQQERERELYGFGSTAAQTTTSGSTGRSSLVELYSGEYDDVFGGGERDSARSSMSMSASMTGSQGGQGTLLSKSTSAQLIRTCGSSTSVSGSSTYSHVPHHHPTHLGLAFSTAVPRASASTPTTPTASPGYSKGLLKGSASTSSFPRPPTTTSPSLTATASSFFSHLRPGSRSGASGGSGSYPTPTFADSFSNLISRRGASGSSKKGQGGHPSVSFQGSLVTHKGGMGQEGSDSAYANPSSSSPCVVMQKSKSSSSVLHHGGGEKRGSTSSTSAGLGMGGSSSGGAGSRLISKTRIFKSRSKSQSRLGGGTTCTWTPQGKCKWTSVTGQQVTLEPTSALTLSEVERVTLQKVALAKLQALNLGVEVKIPREDGSSEPTDVTPEPEEETPQEKTIEKPTSTQKPKRRPYLLKKKALSTGFFDTGNKREDGKEGGSGSLVFGIPLRQCVMNDRQKRGLGPNYLALADWEQAGGYTTSRNGSRNSVSSVYEGGRDEKTGSSESLFWGKRGSTAALDNISCSSADLLADNIPTQPSSAVPTIVTACIRHLETYGLRTMGIFRVSTSVRRIRQLREEIDGSGREVEFGEEHSPHDVAALLKEFLRDLPEPLLCRDLYQAFLLTQKIRNRRLQLEAVQHLIQLLPVPNRDTLATILQFFAKVVENAADTRSSTGEVLCGNKMEGYSLATVIAPNILPFMLPDGSALTTDQNTQTRERRESIDVVNYMISSYKELFLVTPELMDEVYVHMMDTHPDSVETILKFKAAQQQSEDPGLEELDTTSSVFEGSECGEYGEGEDPSSSRRVQKREDILHKDGGKGGQLEARGRGKRDGSRDRGASDAEKQQSGGESDSSSTSVTKSRWFRRGRTDHKARTSSDSGSEKAKGQKRDSSLHEAKRASSLDSVSLKGAGLPTVVQVTEHVTDRPRSSSDQSLKVPESLSRRQSSPVLESVGVITASLKIPVPLNIDDTDIPFIEEESGAEALSHTLHAHHRLLEDTDTDGGPRGRSASTDSSAALQRNTPSASSSHTTTPLSSPLRQTSSEVSSPMTFSPPSSPPYDPATFPYEEMTARFCLGATPLPSHPHLSGPTLSQTTSRTLGPLGDKPGSPTPPTPYIPTSTELPRVGKETKGAAIAGLIKSKTADFEKFAQDQQLGSSIAPNMRLRSQGNIALKQQFLLRQHEKQQIPTSRTGTGSQGEPEGHALPSSRSLFRKKPLAASSSAILARTEPSSSQKPSSSSGASKMGTGPTVTSTGTASRWKRSEIISSPSRHPGPSAGDPETFV